LKGTAIAGRFEEYFWRDDEPFWKERWGVSSYAGYVAGAVQLACFHLEYVKESVC
jgi:hypothetical protein